MAVQNDIYSSWTCLDPSLSPPTYPGFSLTLKPSQASTVDIHSHWAPITSLSTTPTCKAQALAFLTPWASPLQGLLEACSGAACALNEHTASDTSASPSGVSLLNLRTVSNSGPAAEFSSGGIRSNARDACHREQTTTVLAPQAFNSICFVLFTFL